jgi:hypothetical protein
MKWLDVINNPKRFIYGGLLVLLLLILIGFLLGYYMGVHVCENYYLDKLLDLRGKCLMFGNSWR